MRLTLAILFLAFAASAKNIYVSQSGAGAQNGTDAGDAYALSWLTNSANWGAGSSQVNPGDSNLLIGTFTNALIVPGSGTSGHPVTFYFEPGANFTSPCWSNQVGAIYMTAVSWLVIDGANTGIIRNTNNGVGLGLTNTSYGVYGLNVTNITIQNLTITNLFVNAPGFDGHSYGGAYNQFFGSQITVSNCNISDGDGILQVGPSDNQTNGNITIVSNRFFNFNHGCTPAVDNTNSVLTNVVICGNYFDPGFLWDDSDEHLDCVFINSGSVTNTTIAINGIYVYGNYFDGDFGTHTTGAVWSGMEPATQLMNVFVYNNVFVAKTNTWGNGFITIGGSNVWICNNTMIGTNIAGNAIGGGIYWCAGAGGPAYCYNNLLVEGQGINLGAYTLDSNITNKCNCVTDGINGAYILSNYLQNVWADWDICANNNNLSCGYGLKNSSSLNDLWVPGSVGSLTNFQSWEQNLWTAAYIAANYTNTPASAYAAPYLFTYCQLHGDPHGNTNLPTFNAGTWIPATNDTVALGQGTNLSFITTTDYRGSNRPTGTNGWTIGAYEAGVVTTPPSIGITVSVGGQTSISNAIFR